MTGEGPEGDGDRRARIRSLRTAADLATVGLTLVLSIAIGGAFGYYLDLRLGTNWLVIVFTLLGVIAGFQQLIRTVVRANREQEEQDRERRRRGE